MQNFASLIVFYDSLSYVNYLLVPCQSVMLFFFFEVLSETFTWASGASAVTGTVDAASFTVTLFLLLGGPVLPFLFGFIYNPIKGLQDRNKRCSGHYVKKKKKLNLFFLES